MWLLNSSIGEKLIMSISGLFLILFLVFHLCINIAAVFSGEAYNVICGLLGSNWYALLGTLVLAAGVVVHFVYAIILTLQNRKARGNDRYAINWQVFMVTFIRRMVQRLSISTSRAMS